MASQIIYQFYAELSDYKPKLWRRFQVANNASMARLGYILMTMFEMKASHLFCFDVPFEENLKQGMIKRYSESGFLKGLIDDDFLSPGNKNWHIEIMDDDVKYYRRGLDEKLYDAVKSIVKHVVMNPEDCMVFSYDYGDNWKISITLEKIIKDNELPGKELPRVLEGEGFGIIENCGGTRGLDKLAKSFKKRKSSQYTKKCEWL